MKYIKLVSKNFTAALQEKAYCALTDLQIPFERVKTDEAITMGDCVQINKKARRRWSRRCFCATGSRRRFTCSLQLAINLSGLRTSAPHWTPPAFPLRLRNAVQIVFDRDILSEEWYGCSNGTTTGYMKVKTGQILHSFLPSPNMLPLLLRYNLCERHISNTFLHGCDGSGLCQL